MEKMYIHFPVKDNFTEEDSVKLMMSSLNKLINMGAIKGPIDDVLLDYQVEDGGHFIAAKLKKASVVDPSKLISTGGRVSFDPDNYPAELEIPDKQFSTATITERLRISQMDPRLKFRYTIIDYKKFYKNNTRKFKQKPILALKLKEMFIIDMMGIFNEILPFIEDGKQLATLIGTNNVTTGLQSVSRELSLAYRKALRQARGGQISKVIFQNLQKQYNSFMDQLVPQVFPGIEEYAKTSKTSESEDKTVKEKKFSMTETGKLHVELESGNTSELWELLSKIKEGLLTGKVEVIVKSDSDTDTFHLSDKIISIEKERVSTSTYSFTDEGRIKLF